VRTTVASLLTLLLLAAPAWAQTLDVTDDASLRAALGRLGPGVTVRLAPGEYRGGVSTDKAKGDPKRPAVIEAADPERPPVLVGGGSGLHLVGASHVVVRNLVLRGAEHNGINVDDGGQVGSSPGVRLERLRVERVGSGGNHDGIKLSGLDDLTVVDCVVEGWGGSALDMVGCHRVRLEGCRFLGVAELEPDTGVQAKGGSSEVLIRRCAFVEAGQRAVNAGGSTGLEWFRPKDAAFEARAITVEGCTFVGGDCAVAFVGVDGALVRFNTIVRPRRWPLRILQETKGERFAVCKDGRVEDNLFVYRREQVRAFVNVGPDTKPDTFRFARNAWFAEDAPARSAPDLPTPEEGGVHGVDPKLDDQLSPTTPDVRQGAHALPEEKKEKKRR
jgi:hypothetical protein